jgi:hypothetical protein
MEVPLAPDNKNKADSNPVSAVLAYKAAGFGLKRNHPK